MIPNFWEKKTEPTKKSDKDEDSWIPSILRRKKEEKTKTTAKSIKPQKTERIVKPSTTSNSKKVAASTKSVKEQPQEKSRLQNLFNFTKSEEKQPNQMKTTSNDTINPLSVVQSFVSSRLSKPQEQWIAVFPKTRIMPGELVPVTVTGIDLLVVASKDGTRLYCVENSCPHLGTPLETGQLVRLPAETSSTTETSKLAKAWTELEVTNMLQKDGCEDCIVCPLHRTAFALESGEVRGEWCPYPPILGKVMGTVKPPTDAAVFGVRTRGKNVEVRINTPLEKQD